MIRRLMTILMLAALLVLGQTALAESGSDIGKSVTVTITLSESELREPQTIQITVCVANQTGADMPGPCALYGPDGRRVEAFGLPTLKTGQSAECTFDWTVTHEQLNQGCLTVILASTVLDEQGMLATRKYKYNAALSWKQPEPETPQPQIRITLSSNALTQPEEITVLISITNASDVDMPGPLALYNPDGRCIASFSTPALAAGKTVEWTDTWAVTEEQLKAGRIVYTIVYVTQDENGNLSTRMLPFFQRITTSHVEREDRLAVTAAFDREELPTFPGVVKAVIRITNEGNTALSDVRITSASATLYTISEIQPGATLTIQRDVKVSMPGSYRFDASFRNAQGTTTTFQSNVIRMTQTAAPSQDVPEVEEIHAEASPAASAGMSALPIVLVQLLIQLLMGS